MSTQISYNDFQNVDIRVGTIVSVEDFPEARKSAYKLTIDFGSELGLKKSSAQITTLYTKEELVGTQVLCVVNFAPKQIEPFVSEVLTLGVGNEAGDVVLIRPTHTAKSGSKLY